MSLEGWKKRNDVMLIALRADGKITAAGWFNLNHEPNKEEKRDLNAFYRESAGYQIKILTKDDKEKFNAMEWV